LPASAELRLGFARVEFGGGATMTIELAYRYERRISAKAFEGVR
jgi:hypothetical protein